MAQNLPADDTFTDAVTPRNAAWFGYGFFQPSSTNPAYGSGGSGTTLNATTSGRLYTGWFGQAVTPPSGASSNPAAVVDRIGGAPATVMQTAGFFWRQLSLGDCGVEVCWQLQSDNVASMTASGAQLLAGVAARVQGGSWLTNGEFTELSGVTGYYFVITSQSSSPFGWKYELLSVNTGTITRLQDSPTGASTFTPFATGMFTTPQHLRMTVEAEAGNVRIKCYARLETEVLEHTIFDFLDNTGTKITTAGRVGFVFSNERKPSGTFIYAPCINWWQVATPDNKTIYLRDEWERANPQGTLFEPATVAWRTGYSLMSSWYGDLYGANGVWPEATNQVLWSDGPVSGLDRLVFFAPAVFKNNIDGIVLSQRPADSTGSQDRTIVGRYGNAGTGLQQRAFGIALRCSPVAPSALPHCYYCVHEIDDVGMTAAVRLYRSSSDGLVLIAEKTGLTYALDTDVSLRMTIASVAPDDIARLRVRIAGVLVVLVAPGVPVSGVTIAGDGTVDDASTERVFSGTAEGLYVRKRHPGDGSTLRPLYLDSWAQGPGESYDPIEPPPPPPPPLDLTPIAVSSEIDGAFGTLVLGKGGQWEVDLDQSDPGIVHHYENDTAQSFPVESRIRRSWTIKNNAVGSPADAALLVDFDAHGCELPISWVTDEGDTAYVVFTTPDLPQRMRAPGAFGYEFGLQERFTP